MTKKIRSVQCCINSQWVYLRCSLLPFSRFKTLGSSHSWICSLCYIPASSRGSTPTNTVSSSSGSIRLYISTVQPGLSGPLSANAVLPSHPRFQTPYPSSAHFLLLHPAYPLMFLAVFLHLLLLFPLFNGMPGVFPSEALNYYTLSRFILWILSESKNPILTHLSLWGSLDFLLCDLIALIPRLTFVLPITRTLTVASSFSLGKVYPFLNFLPSLSLCLTPTLIT